MYKTLNSKRTDLEEVIKQEDIFQQELELQIYDLMINCVKKYENSINKEIETVMQKLRGSLTLPNEEESRKYLKNWYMKNSPHPAFIILLGFKTRSKKHLDNITGSNITSTIFNKKIYDSDIISELENIAFEDGAIILTKDGTIYAVNAKFKHLISEPCFKEQVGTRQDASLNASKIMSNTVVYTLGESGIIRRFKKGKISFSTLNGE